MPTELLPSTLDLQAVINAGCSDISKRKVEREFYNLFGYPMAVDPLSFGGTCVKKSNENGRHDGALVECPISTVDSDSVYHVLVETVGDDGFVEDLRVSVIGRTLPLVYRKRRPVETRFSNKNTSVILDEARNVFTASERGRLLGFARAMGMDCGELDVLRHKDSRLIYIVDANRTAVGPPNGLTEAEGQRAISLMAEAFRDEFLM
jgi:hypothetical protein